MGKWLNDSGSWRGITPSIEGRYANDPERHRFAEDKETARRRGEVRYNPLIAGQVERVVNQLAQGKGRCSARGMSITRSWRTRISRGGWR